ncbi:MAG TPA: hypothetical protein PLD54_01575 [Candidatus Levybacteria bacterium]|nr:hypothetical protein [Candidatus Levybacteria bacterium]
MEKHEVQTVQGRILIVGIFLLFTLALMTSFYTVYDTQPLQQNSKAGDVLGNERGQNVSLEEVVADPTAFVGQVISVRGIVQDQIGTQGLTIDTTNIETEKLLVVSRDALIGVGSGPGESAYGKYDGVRVSGVVRMFSLSELETEIGTDLNDETYQAYEGKPVIIADSIYELQK